jgi:primosomal protein N' (replication factor Y)
VKSLLEKPYAEVVFNLPIKEVFTYKIPPQFAEKVQVGMRVFVPFGRRRITGYVVDFTAKWDKDIKLKSINDLPDTKPVVGEEILALTKWLSGYYQCAWGEAIRAALPAGYDDESREEFSLTEMGADALLNGSLSKPATLLLHFIGEHPKATSKQCQKGLGKKFSAHSLASLKQDGLLTSTEAIHKSTIGYQFLKTARLKPNLPKHEEIEQLLKRSPKQKQVYDQLLKGEMGTIDLEIQIKGSAAALRSLKDKGLVETFSKKVERTSHVDTSNQPIGPSLKFTLEQKKVFVELDAAIRDSKFQTFLLHGVTGRGKT